MRMPVVLEKFIGQSKEQGKGGRGLFDGDGAAAPRWQIVYRGPEQRGIDDLGEERALGVGGDALDPIAARHKHHHRRTQRDASGEK